MCSGMRGKQGLLRSLGWRFHYRFVVLAVYEDMFGNRISILTNSLNVYWHLFRPWETLE